MLIEQPARWLRIFYPHALWRMDKNDHSVYLTFDDGPIPEATPFILDVLDQFNAKAMFFMVADNVRKHPEIYEEVIRRGHKVGNHTYHHLDIDLCRRCNQGRRSSQISLLSSSAWMVATYSILVGKTELSCCDVGPCDT